MKLIMKADLHNHSYYSDGLMSTSEVDNLESAAVCVTYNDTTKVITEAQLETDKLLYFL